MTAEAVFRAGECLSKLSDERARVWFERVVREHAGSPYAAEAGRMMR